jgi:hypothetical protein
MKQRKEGRKERRKEGRTETQATEGEQGRRES